MNSLITLSYSSLTTPRLSFPTRRRSRRPRRTPLRHNPCTTSDTNRANPLSKPTSLDYESINLVVDFNQISILSSSKSRFDQFVSSAEEAYYDLRSAVSVDHNGRLVVSCRRLTLQFVGTLLASGFVLLFVCRVLASLGLGLRARFGAAKRSVVVRRDRSLGGKEVVVGTTEDEWGRSFNRPLENPLSLGRKTGSGSSGRVRTGFQVRAEDKLPKWWPVTMASEQTLLVDKEEYQREVNRLIRAIIDRRTSGQDVMADDIIQLRRLCRTSGVRVSIDTINTRDSLYRTSVDFVLNVCSWELSQSASVQIGGEDARQFVAGLADNIGLENIRAARMVSAAVAARTRSCFLQAWALEMQGNHFEAVSELGKICRVFRIFPPEESSPEMEMVARGLEKLLKVEQREQLMNMLVGVCSEESQRSAAEALGLVLSPEGNADHQY